MIKLSRMTDYGVVVMAHLAGAATPGGGLRTGHGAGDFGCDGP